MKKSLYLRGKIGQHWYNSTEYLAYALLFEKLDTKSLEYDKLHYAQNDKFETVNTCFRKDLCGNKKPVFLYIHGGGWISGIVDMRNAYVRNYARLGFFTASIDYTPAPQAVYPTQVQQCLAAVDWLYANADKYNLDMSNILVAGESAGGYFVAMLASLAADKSLYDKIGLKFDHKDDFAPTAIITHCGALDIERMYDKTKEQSKFPDIRMMCRTFVGKNDKELKEWIASPEGKIASPHASALYPPTFVVWAAKDWLRYDSFDFLKELEDAGVEHGVFSAGKAIASHAWSIVTKLKGGKECLKATYDFVLPHFDKYFEKDKEDWHFKD